MNPSGGRKELVKIVDEQQFSLFEAGLSELFLSGEA
jgi:hypothetical protein